MAWLYGLNAQPVINERYAYNDETITVFSSVKATDSCYYVGGFQTSFLGLNQMESAFIRFNFDGTIDSLRTIENDTIGIGFWRTNEIIQTLDHNFACLAVADGDNAIQSFMMLKFNQYGDTLWTKFYPEFYEEDLQIGKEPGVVYQAQDSSYFCVVSTQREDDLRAPTLFFRLDKLGNLMFYKVFYGLGVSTYHILKPNGLVRKSSNQFVIGANLLDVNGESDEQRYHTKLLIVDTLGNLIDEHTYWEDTLALDCYGLTKTTDGGLIYAGRIGRYFPDDEVIGYRGQIVKLNADFEIDWKLRVGNYNGFPYIGIRNILSLNDSEFVAVGYMKEFKPKDRNQYGWLIKFNIDGKKIWERKYLKVSHEHLAPNYPEHELFDVDTTSDGGFVMVGSVINYENEDELPGQKAWLVKTNRYGCIVPGCQFGDIEANPEPVDTSDITPDPPQQPINLLYPNPANNSLFYYHHQDHFNYGTAYIYNSAGQLIQQWEITTNNITYAIDVSAFAAGNYLLQVLDQDGKLIEVERFVKR